MVPPPSPGSTERTRVRRSPDKAVADESALHAILDAALLAHVAVVDDGQPYAVPVACARDGDRLLLHGSTGSRLFRRLTEGSPACVTVTLVDGLVLARSAFESSMNYRCAMVLGQCTPLRDTEKEAALERLTEHLLPGRWPQLRPLARKEIAATTVLAMPLAECSVKISSGDPEDPDEDLGWPIWAGVVPVEHRFGAPVPAADLAYELEPPAYIGGWPNGRT